MMGVGSIAIVASAREKIRTRDLHYPFKQNTNFSYLCGFPEPDAVLVLIPGREQGECVLFCREKDKLRETWDGYREGPEGAIANYAADDAFPVADIDEILPGLLEGRERVYYAIGKDAEFDKRLMDWVNNIRKQKGRGAAPPGEFVDLDHLLHEMRLVKKAGEVRLMRKAGEISAQAHIRAMQTCAPGMLEYQLQAELEHEFVMSGASGPAYSTIIGGGKNGCILHYIENRDKLRKGDLVLIDAGCEYRNYAADISRTFPVSGRFSKQQAAIYDIVLDAQAAAIAAIAPGTPYNSLNKETIAVITQGLKDLKILKGDVQELVEKEAYREFYMHSAGHWLGMDVHDVGDYKVDNQWREFETGMVTTVEPGIYIAPDNTNVASQWRGLAVRIEDNILVTRTGNQNLTDGVPKQRAEIERLMAA